VDGLRKNLRDQLAKLESADTILAREPECVILVHFFFWIFAHSKRSRELLGK
jgi:hypothetical protein